LVLRRIPNSICFQDYLNIRYNFNTLFYIIIGVYYLSFKLIIYADLRDKDKQRL